MIRFSDALVLAGVKLRTRKLRTILSIVISSILFAILIMAFVLMDGMTKSLATFNKQGLNNRYLVIASPINTLPNGWSQSKDFLNYANQRYTQIVNAKVVDAKRLGVVYDPKNEPLPIVTQVIPGQGQISRINLGSSIVQQIFTEYTQLHPIPGIGDLQKIAAPYRPVSVAQDALANFMGSVSLMKDGKENFSPTDGEDKDLQFLQGQSVTVVDQVLSSPFLLPGLDINRQAVPLIVSYGVAEKMLGLTPLPADVNTADKVNRIQELYQRAGSLTFTACYRNNASSSQISQAIQQATDSAAHKAGYQKPGLMYGLPAVNSCGQAPVIADTRTISDKKAAIAEDQFNADFGQQVTPLQQKVLFQVVGLAPNSPTDSSLTFGDLLSHFTQSSLNDEMAIPKNLLEGMTDLPSIKQILAYDPSKDNSTRVNYFAVEFTNANDARKFIDHESCMPNIDGICPDAAKHFTLTAYANNTIALSDLEEKASIILKIATVAVAIFASVIMWNLIGRTIADSRRETAVFRALGANRGDIAMIYTLYTLYLVTATSLLALGIGLVGACIAQILYHDSATQFAKLMFSAVNSNIVFSFFAINPITLVAIVGVVLIAGLLGLLFPLIRNVPRSPLLDMREE